MKQPFRQFPSTRLVICITVAMLFAVGSFLRSAPPATLPTKVDYATAVRPIFQAHCAKCHLDGVRKGSMDLGSRENLLKGGESETPAVVPHDSANSRLIDVLTSDDPDVRMPQKAMPLAAEQIATIKSWIDHGAPWGDAPGAEPKYVAPLEPRIVALPDGPEKNPIDRILFSPRAHAGSEPREGAGTKREIETVDDRTFARRAYLDTIGLIPSAAQIDSFVNDTASDKRQKLVEQLLGDNRKYAEHWMSFWNDCLRNDYTGTGYIDGGRKQITGWLYNALASNMPYDQFVRELIDAKPDNAGFINGIVWRGAVSASQGKEVQAAQNITQVFLGLNFKCNSCHDSFISDWKLADSYGLAGVFADKPMEMYRCEKPTGQIAKVKFLYPQLGSIDGDAPRATKVKQLASLMTARGNGRFTRTIVNRLWARFMGRGIVEPVDEMDQKPWNADLLDWLADDLADHNYDIKHTIALILTSRAYQMPTVGMQERIDANYVFAGPVVRRMSAEQFCDAVSALTGEWHPAPVSKEALELPQFAIAARWIWTNTDAKKKAPVEEVYFRKVVDLPEAPAEATVAATCDNEYDLYVNGSLVSQGRDWMKPDVLDLAPYLVKGANVFAVVARNGTITDLNTHVVQQESPAGLWLLASLRFANGQLMDIGTDAGWQFSRTKSDGWDTASFNAADWKPAADLGPAATGVWTKLPAALNEAKKPFTFRFEKVRAVWVKNDRLMTALGRPNREQVVTNRFTPATMLQMLELTNGKMMSDLVSKGAARWMDRKFDSSQQLIHEMYHEALGRAPSHDELELSKDLVGSPANPQGVEDLLWSLMMLPEFQLIY